MPTLKSLEDLKRIREEAIKKQELKSSSGKTEVIVGMGTVGIASGARETLKAILDFIETYQLDSIIVRQTGNIGLDSLEPVVQVVLPGAEKVTYGKVNPAMIERIMREHVIDGNPVIDFKVEN